MTSHGPANHLLHSKDVIWREVHDLGEHYTSCDMGIGSPEEGLHHGIVKELARISSDPDKFCELHQSSLFNGHPRLLNVLAKFYAPLLKREIDPWNEILVTCGASYAIFCSAMGILNQGDEVIIFEPFFDLFPAVVKQARGTPVYVPLTPPRDGAKSSADWKLDAQELEKKITTKTKMIIVNSPHNPLGKVFSKAELESIAEMAIKYDLLVLSDEVYEFLLYEGGKHIKMASLPGMWERTITLGSASKIFNVTGWRVGWAIAPAHLHRCLGLVHQDCSREIQTPFQVAIAFGLEEEMKLLGSESSYWTQTCAKLQEKRDLLAGYLSSVGITPGIPQGTYFMTANISNLASKLNLEKEGQTTDVAFFRWLCKEKGLLSVPMSAFFTDKNKHIGENYVRLCFIKKKSTLESARKILEEIQF